MLSWLVQHLLFQVLILGPLSQATRGKEGRTHIYSCPLLLRYVDNKTVASNHSIYTCRLRAAGDYLARGGCWCWGAVFVFEVGWMEQWCYGFASAILESIRMRYWEGLCSLATRGGLPSSFRTQTPLFGERKMLHCSIT